LIARINAEAHDNIPQRFGFNAWPTIAIIKKG